MRTPHEMLSPLAIEERASAGIENPPEGLSGVTTLVMDMGRWVG